MIFDFRRAAVGLACLTALCGGAAAPSSDISVSAPWTRPASAGGNGVGYMKITNNGTGDDVLLGGSSDAAGSVEVHETTIDDKGVASMHKLDAVAIKAGQSIELKPAGMHAMFIGLKEPLTEGGVLKATLKFKNAGNVDVDYAVKAAGPSAAEGPRAHAPPTLTPNLRPVSFSGRPAAARCCAPTRALPDCRARTWRYRAGHARPSRSGRSCAPSPPRRCPPPRTDP